MGDRGRVAGDYDVHLLTLAHVPVRIEGSWPGSIVMTSGWNRATARPWNDTVVDPMVRLDRGGADFLSSVVAKFREMGLRDVFSPALYPGSTRIWERAGFTEHVSLVVMERSLSGAVQKVDNVSFTEEPPWEEIHELDTRAFDGFWGMSQLGLRDAFSTNSSSAVAIIRVSGELSGYSLLGSQWGVAYLHRIAVHPDLTGRGHGRNLLWASIGWGRNLGARSMLLNVRRENEMARALYKRVGFADTRADLQVLRNTVQ